MGGRVAHRSAIELFDLRWAHFTKQVRILRS